MRYRLTLGCGSGFVLSGNPAQLSERFATQQRISPRQEQPYGFEMWYFHVGLLTRVDRDYNLTREKVNYLRERICWRQKGTVSRES